MTNFHSYDGKDHGKDQDNDLDRHNSMGSGGGGGGGGYRSTSPHPIFTSGSKSSSAKESPRIFSTLLRSSDSSNEKGRERDKDRNSYLSDVSNQSDRNDNEGDEFNMEGEGESDSGSDSECEEQDENNESGQGQGHGGGQGQGRGDGQGQGQGQGRNGGVSDDDIKSIPFLWPTPLRTFFGHTQDVIDISWSKSHFILSASADHNVRLWHVTRGDCLQVFRHPDIATSIDFHPLHDRYFISGCFDRKLRVWDIISDARTKEWVSLSETVSKVIVMYSCAVLQ